MCDIFISYRRADGGWARSLCDALENDFDVFFDIESIDYGDEFPRRIEEGLKTCCVFLCVIGPEWLNSSQRLRDQKDWVRREILSAIERKASGARVVPLTIGGASLPDEKTLPEELRPLMTFNACQLTHHNWKTDVEELRNRVRQWLLRTPGANPQWQELPPVLPYLCNRVAQEEHLIEHWPRMSDGSFRLNPVVVLHGHKWEEHDGFLDRLKWRAGFTEIFKTLGSEMAFRECHLDWNRPKAIRGDYNGALRSALKRRVLENSAATDQMLRQYLEMLAQPLLVIIQITWTDCEECGKKVIAGFARAWKSLFTVDNTVSSAREISPARPAIFWVNITYDEVRQEANLSGVENDLNACALPKLEAIEDSDIADWIGFPDVKWFLRNNLTARMRLLDLPQDDRCCFEKGKIHMLRFVQAVKEILTPA